MALKMVKLNPDPVRSLINWTPGSVVYVFRILNKTFRDPEHCLDTYITHIHSALQTDPNEFNCSAAKISNAVSQNFLHFFSEN
jgi:hypothetical protein